MTSPPRKPIGRNLVAKALAKFRPKLEKDRSKEIPRRAKHKKEEDV